MGGDDLVVLCSMHISSATSLSPPEVSHSYAGFPTSQGTVWCGLACVHRGMWATRDFKRNSLQGWHHVGVHPESISRETARHEGHCQSVLGPPGLWETARYTERSTQGRP